MPESVIPDKYASQIPRFTLPPELTNPAPEAPAVPPKEEAKSPVAEAATTPPETEAEVEKPGEPDKETTEKDPEKASTRRFERRIDRAIRARAEAQARAEVLERELAELKQKQVPLPTGAPKVEDFTDLAEFQKAVEKHARETAIKDYQESQRSEGQKAAQLKLTQNWEAKVLKAVQEYDDFDEVVGDLKPTSAWSVAIMEAENGGEIAYYLGKHPSEVEKIMSLNPVSQVREIGKLEWKLAHTEIAPKTPSKAPAPIIPVTGAGQARTDEISPNQPFEEYRKIGNKMFRGRR